MEGRKREIKRGSEERNKIRKQKNKVMKKDTHGALHRQPTTGKPSSLSEGKA
jgi:hypothetical protein